MKIIQKIFLFLLPFIALQLNAGELHVSMAGSDTFPGTKEKPLRTIQHAAMLAQAGDTITVYSGIYRERINPPRGGASDSMRIVYRAAPGETVEIKGSEVVKGWEKTDGHVWKVILEKDFFGAFNPFADTIHGDWFNRFDRTLHTGAVYLNGEWLTEAAKLDELFLPDQKKPSWVLENQKYINPNLWFAKVQDGMTTIWAQFPGNNPNEELVEVNTRQTIFYPDEPGRNFITVDGFVMRHAATPWAPPTAEQIGLIGTHWSKGWIIKNCTISHSSCTGITLGKYGDDRDNLAGSAIGYVGTINNALQYKIPWNKEHIGSHVVRNNYIHHCEQAGIVGSMGAAFSVIEHNKIHHIHTKRLFGGAEMAAIKLHGGINALIKGNLVHDCYFGIWLDWMGQNARVSGNLLYNNSSQDLYLEVNHGPLMVDNNIMLSETSVWDMSQGSAYAHNLFAGMIIAQPERNRETPYHPNNETTVSGLEYIRGGDNRFYNNIFIGNGSDGSVEPVTHRAVRLTRPHHNPMGAGYGLWAYDDQEYPIQTEGNVYLNGARPYKEEVNAILLSDIDSGLSFNQHSKTLTVTLGNLGSIASSPLVTTDLLGKPIITKELYIDTDGGFLIVNKDYFGGLRNQDNPAPGPFENPGQGVFSLDRW